MSRQLATIRTVDDITPIEGKDKIVLSTITGWHIITKKDEFQVGDKCVFIEIDSVLPEKPEFEFLRGKDFRIRTMKMSGVVSQGIAFPLDILPQGKDYKVGQDVSDILGVKEYIGSMDTGNETETSKKHHYPKFLMRYMWFRKLILPKKESKGFPTFIAKTDETRIQNAPSYLKNKNQKWIATEKVDGMSSTYVLEKKKGHFGKEKFSYYVCSHNLRLDPNANSPIWDVSKKYAIEEFLKEFINLHSDYKWVAIQGECVASKVQGNKYKVKEPDLLVFNLLTPDGRYGSLDAKKIVESRNLKFVPIISNGMTLPDTVDDVLAFAHGRSAVGDTLREGIVFRTLDGKQSFKAVDPLFLLKYNE